ncbi:S8 family peptidase [Streptomyces lavendulocolor]|uniref:S8 family peptidase n=1 Tax=Streptomyces lavendulocolor TaxID=67316 RepID=UPI00340D79A1
MAALIILPDAATAAPSDFTSGGTNSKMAPVFSYLVNTKEQSVDFEQVEHAIVTSGGVIIKTYKEIGVIFARSAAPNFAQRIRSVAGVHSAGVTRSTALRSPTTTLVGKPFKLHPRSPLDAAWRLSNSQEPLEAEQWSLRAVQADQAAALNPGSADVTVAVIDTGVDETHPDLADNFSTAQSASCVGGVADTTPGAWRPNDPERDYHGTHVAGSIAASRNGYGIAGVAPNVKVAAIKVSEPNSGSFHAESVVCAFMFAAETGVEITNNSYYVDPWLFNCLSNADQRAVVESVNRAIQHSRGRGVLSVAAAGNANQDLAEPFLVDTMSPNGTIPVRRIVSPIRCPQIPAMLPGMITVSATGAQNLKSSFSNYGLGVIDVAGPGGDDYQTPQTPLMNGGVLSTMPGQRYAFLQGTSMAAPHVAGVAALIRSARPDATISEIERTLRIHADNPGCPAGPYDPNGDGRADARCIGGARHNSFYGFGIVDALSAVTA